MGLPRDANSWWSTFSHGEMNPHARRNGMEESQVQNEEKVGLLYAYNFKIFVADLLRLNTLIYFTCIRSNLDYHAKIYDII